MTSVHGVFLFLCLYTTTSAILYTKIQSRKDVLVWEGTMLSKERKESENIMASATYGLTQNYRGTKQLGDIGEKHTHSNDVQLDLRKSEGKLKDRQALNFLLTKHNRNYATDKQVQTRIVQHLRSLRRARRFQPTAIRYNRFPPTHKRQHDPKSLIFCGIDEDKRIRVRRAPRPEDPSSEPEPDAIQNIERASSTPEPESNPPHQSEPEPEAESSWPEPGPNWSAAIKQWRVAWSLHVYGFATIFTVLSFYSALEMALLCSSKKPKNSSKSHNISNDINIQHDPCNWVICGPLWLNRTDERHRYPASHLNRETLHHFCPQPTTSGADRHNESRHFAAKVPASSQHRPRGRSTRGFASGDGVYRD